MTEPIVPEPPKRSRIGLWVALGITVVAVPLLFLDNLGGDDGGGAVNVPKVTIVSPVSPQENRPESGPPKGVSVVTSSTTSSTLPITTTTTTPPIETTSSAPLTTTTTTTTTSVP